MKKSIQVLLVEDNHGDVVLVREAFKAAAATVTLHVVVDGIQALKTVRSKNVNFDLIILDLNLPIKNGSEVLHELKNDPDFKHIPIVVFTSSGSSADIRAAYAGYANSYIRKPSEVDAFFAAIAGLEQYWTTVVSLPAV